MKQEHQYAEAQQFVAAPASYSQAPAVAYLDIGAGGYLDLGTDLTDEALSHLPKGRHALVIAGTYGIDGYIAAPNTHPAPQQEVQEPVEIPTKCPYFGPSPHRDVWLEGWYAARATRPSPASQGDALDARDAPQDIGGHMFRAAYQAQEGIGEDAARYRFMTDDHASRNVREELDGIALHMTIRGKGATDAAIDAIRAVKKGGV